MADFAINADVTTDQPTVEVTLSTDKPLSLGRHRFRLIVVDDAGNKSIGDEVEVVVADQENPTAILSAPGVVDFGKSFVLDGSRSFDVGGGRITSYQWTYLGPTPLIVSPTLTTPAGTAVPRPA